MSLRERMAALANKGEKADSGSRPAHVKIATPKASGNLVHAGFIKRSAGESKLTSVMFTRYTELFSDPLLLFFDDETHAVPKGGFELVKGHTCVLDGMVCVIEPAKGVKAKSLKLQATSEEEQAVSYATEGPCSPRAYEIRPAAKQCPVPPRS